MNFPAHAYVALQVAGDDPGLVFGAILPDLTAIAGVRFDRELPAAVLAGRRLHHRTDECFHDSAGFRAGAGGLRVALRGHGMASGPSRAGAHLGYELLLDTFLPWNDAASRALDDGLAHGSELAAGLDPDARRRWTLLLGRLREADWSAMSAMTDTVVAERIEVVLSRRPRLALPIGARDAVTAAVAAARPGVGQASGHVLVSVLAAVRR